MNAISEPIVAVIDDDPRIRESLESLIESVGVKAQVYSLADEFLHGDHLSRTSCLITDIRMPGVDGLDLQRLARLERPDLPVIFITAHHDERVERRAFAEGAAFIFYEPFDADELLQAIKLTLSKIHVDNEKSL